MVYERGLEDPQRTNGAIPSLLAFQAIRNLSLWAKYAAGHTGYCLESANAGPLFENTIDVDYGECAPFNLIDSKNRTASFLVHKRPEWSNEEEVRLIGARGSGPIVRIEPQWLTRIILGKDMMVDKQKEVRGWALERKPILRVAQAYFQGLRRNARER